jgi:hypothetical protein
MSRGSNCSKTFETTLIEGMPNLRTFIEDNKTILENLTKGRPVEPIRPMPPANLPIATRTECAARRAKPVGRGYSRSVGAQIAVWPESTCRTNHETPCRQRYRRSR